MRLLYLHTGRPEENKANCLQVLQMCLAFRRLGVDVTLAINSYELDEAGARRALAAQLGQADLPFALRVYSGRRLLGRFRSLGCVGAVRRVCRETPHDAAFVRDPVLLPWIARECAAVIFESHNRLPGGVRGWLVGPWRRRVLGELSRPRVRLVVAISQALADWWAGAGVPRAKLLAAHDGIDPERYAALPSKAEARRALGLRAEGPVAVYAGSLYGDRSIPTLLALARQRPDVLMVIVGGPEDARQRYAAEARAQGLANVRFTGRVPFRDVPLHLAAADVLLMLWSEDVPTIRYCSPLKVFEYMAAERTIVGHRFPTIEEVVTHGTHAYLADPRSFDELSALFARAVDAPDAGLAAAARARVTEHYTWEQRCKAILEAFGR